MKKIFLISTTVFLLSGYSANAQVSVTFGEPAYVAPAYPYAAPYGYAITSDWPSDHYDVHRHRHNDYWAHRMHDERGEHEREEHRG